MICGIICQQVEAGAGVATTWDPDKKHADITLSGGNLIATQTTTGNYRNVKSVVGQDTGKRYFECRLNAVTSATDVIVIGLGTVAASLSSFISQTGGSSYSCGLAADGLTYDGPSGGIGTDIGKPIAVAEWAGIAVDFTASKAWVRDATGWSGDPVAGTGNSFTLPGNVLYAMVGGFTTGDQIEANFGASAFAYAIPSGFTNWAGGGGGEESSEAVASASGVGIALAVSEAGAAIATAAGTGTAAATSESTVASDASAAGTGTGSAVGDEVGIPWTPADGGLGSSLSLWFDASDAATVTEAAAVISQWDDKSGNNLDVTPASTRNPTYVTAEQNGLNVIRFDGGDNLRKTSGVSPLVPFNQTTFLVAKPTASGGNNLYWTTNGSAIRGVIQYSTSNLRYQGSSNNHANTNPSDAWHMHSGYINTAERSVYTDGVLANSNTTGTDTSTTLATQIWFGSDSNPLAFYTGDLGEFVQYNGTLNQADREKVEGYLAHKWDLAGLLDSGHPYKNDPPTI